MDRQSDKITALYCRIGKPFDIGKDAAVAHAQIDRLSQYAKEHNLKNPKFFCDWGYSGTTSDRPEYQRMLREVEAGKVAALVVVDLFCLVRNSFDAWELIGDILPKYGVALHSIKEGGELQDSFLQTRKSVVELYRFDVEGRRV